MEFDRSFLELVTGLQGQRPKGKFHSCTANVVSFDSLDLEIQIKDGTSYQVV